MFNRYIISLGIACTLYAHEPSGATQTQEQMADNLYEVVRASGYSDEKKAELYAHLADVLTPALTFKQAQTLIEDCLTKTESV